VRYVKSPKKSADLKFLQNIMRSISVYRLDESLRSATKRRKNNTTIEA